VQRHLADYFDRNQARLMVNIEAAAKESPKRMALICGIVLALTPYTSLRMSMITLLFCVLDDLVLFALRARLRRDQRRTDFLILGVFYVLGASAFALFLAHFQFIETEPVARFCGLVVLMAALAEMASPKSASHVFPLVSVVPIWLAFYASLGVTVVHIVHSPMAALIGSSILMISAGYVTSLFIANARRNRHLEMETARANAASNQKSAFLAQVSHEIRTPLNAVYGTAQLLGHASDLQQMRRLGRTLETAAADLKVLVDDVIDYAEFDRVSDAVRLVPTDIAELSVHAGELVRANAQAKGLTLVVHADRSTGWAMADPVRLRQILVNLLANAVTTSAQGTVSLHQSLAERGRYLSFQVRNSGVVAMDATIGSGPALQSPTEAGQISGGGGLGFTISHMLAASMGGYIKVNQMPGGSLAISAMIPFVSASERAEQTTPPPAKVSAAPPPSKPAPAPQLQGRKVLVVDDVAINREVVRAMLELQGAEVIEANDGSIALELVTQHRFDLILLDNMMPHLSGIETLRQLRALPSPARDLTVIGLSAGTLQSERDEFLATGLNGFLSKPLSMRNLCEVIQAHEAERQADWTKAV
jgi:CheY-like chemotaxis protein/signal transduction histidine kinase